MNLTLRRSGGIGDVVASTTVAYALAEQGHRVSIQCHHSIHSVVRRCPDIQMVDSPKGYCDVDLDGCYEKHAERKTRHLYEMLFESANHQLFKNGICIGVPGKVRPILFPNASSVLAVNDQYNQYKKPWIGVVPRSDFYRVRQVPDRIWESLPAMINGTCFWLGTHPGPKSFNDIKCRTLERLMDMISSMDVVVTVDTGPMHMAVGLGKPLVVIKQAVDPWLRIPLQYPAVVVGNDLDCLNCQGNICPKSEFDPPCQEVDMGKVAEGVRRLGLKGLM